MSVAYEQKASAGLEELGLKVARGQLEQAAQQAAANAWPYSHFLGYLLETELAWWHEKMVRLNLQFANLPYQKRLDSFDFAAQPSIDRRIVDELATGRFSHEGRNLNPDAEDLDDGACDMSSPFAHPPCGPVSSQALRRRRVIRGPGSPRFAALHIGVHRAILVHQREPLIPR